jgi:hypothetical protein
LANQRRRVAQEGNRWLGADVLDMTKVEADKIIWDSPHGAKLGVVAAGSPADKAGQDRQPCSRTLLMHRSILPSHASQLAGVTLRRVRRLCR